MLPTRYVRQRRTPQALIDKLSQILPAKFVQLGTG